MRILVTGGAGFIGSHAANRAWWEPLHRPAPPARPGAAE